MAPFSNEIRGVFSAPLLLKEARMGIFTYLKIGLAVVVLSVCGYFVYEYKHMASEIVGLKTEISGLKLRADVIEKAQKATDAFMQTKGKVVKRNVQEHAVIDQAVELGDDPAMQSLFMQYGLLQPQSGGAAPSRPKSNP